MFSFFKKKAPATEVEFSTNLDTKNVGPFLESVSRLIEAGFGDAERRQVLAQMSLVSSKEGVNASFPVRHGGRDSVLKIAIISDSIDTVLIYLVVDPSLHAAIDQEMDRFAEEAGI